MPRGRANNKNRANQNAVKNQIQSRERLYESFNFETASIQDLEELRDRLKADFDGFSLSGQRKIIKFDEVSSNKRKLNGYIRETEVKLEEMPSRKAFIEKTISPIAEKIRGWIELNTTHQDKGSADVFLAELNISGKKYIENGNIKQFNQSLKSAITHLEKSNLNQDPKWRDGVIPALKQFANYVISLFSNNRNNFWKTSEQKNIVEIHRAIDSAIEPDQDLRDGLGVN